MFRIPRRRASSFTLLVLFISVPCIAFADARILKVRVDPGGIVGLAFRDAQGNVVGAGGTDTDLNGVVTFTVPENAVLVTVVKDFNGKKVVSRVRLTGGVTFASLEPFTIPGFSESSGTTTLVGDIATPDLHIDGTVFVLGQVVALTNGSISETDTILFKNGSSLALDPLAAAVAIADEATFEALPNFTGLAEVQTLDEFLESVRVPTISDLGAIGLAVLLLAAMTMTLRNRHKRFPMPPGGG